MEAIFLSFSFLLSEDFDLANPAFYAIYVLDVQKLNK